MQKGGSFNIACMSSGRQLRPASLLRVVLAVARVTFMEILRDKVLYNTVVITALLFAVGVLASRLTFIRPDRIILDFGLTGIALSNGLLSVMIGSAMVAREFERRTILVALTKPITRFQFLLGKFAGLKAVLMLNSLLLSVAYLGILKMLGQPGAVSPFTATLGSALFLLALQSLVLAALAIFFSSFSTTSLSVMMTIGVYLVGINTSQIRILALKQESPFAKSAISAVTWFFPNFEHFNLGFKVTYGLPVLPSFVALGAAYATVWCLLLMLMAGWLIQRRES
jgi:ABC-type transport system involved in multi-copper enzyme maturation permease subunit